MSWGGGLPGSGGGGDGGLFARARARHQFEQSQPHQQHQPSEAFVFCLAPYVDTSTQQLSSFYEYKLIMQEVTTGDFAALNIMLQAKLRKYCSAWQHTHGDFDGCLSAFNKIKHVCSFFTSDCNQKLSEAVSNSNSNDGQAEAVQVSWQDITQAIVWSGVHKGQIDRIDAAIKAAAAAAQAALAPPPISSLGTPSASPFVYNGFTAPTAGNAFDANPTVKNVEIRRYLKSSAKKK